MVSRWACLASCNMTDVVLCYVQCWLKEGRTAYRGQSSSSRPRATKKLQVRIVLGGSEGDRGYALDNQKHILIPWKQNKNLWKVLKKICHELPYCLQRFIWQVWRHYELFVLAVPAMAVRPGGLSGLILGICCVAVVGHVWRCTRCYAFCCAALRMYKYLGPRCRHGRRHLVFVKVTTSPCWHGGAWHCQEMVQFPLSVVSWVGRI